MNDFIALLQREPARARSVTIGRGTEQIRILNVDYWKKGLKSYISGPSLAHVLGYHIANIMST